MKKTHLLILTLFTLALAACQATDNNSAEPTAQATAPIAEVQTESTTPEPALTEETEFAPVVIDDTATPPSEPTAMPTDEPEPEPTATPYPDNPVDSIQLESVWQGGLERPLYLTHAGDDRIFILEQAGRIRILEDGQLLSTPFLDISGQVTTGSNEQGLLGLAFHPDYANNGRFFVNYSMLDGTTSISEFRVSEDPNSAEVGSEQVLLTIDQPYGNHNGGMLAFGPDGYLYVAVGDGGSANDPQNNGQNAATLLGSLLRLDVDSVEGGYATPADNPFVDDDRWANEIWAWGLRNPWRFSFDRVTGDLFISDVGQNTYEEINLQPADSEGGENYGWVTMEGFHCFSDPSCNTTGLTLPIFEYDHASGCSITGGYIYRGAAYPELTGNYFLADYCTGIIWRLFEGDDGWNSAVVLDTDHVISSFGEDVNGELYVIDHPNGEILRIVP